MYYLRNGINEPLHGTTPALKVEEVALGAITKLLETYALTPPPPTNRQNSNPCRKTGTIELPLWEHTATVNSKSPNWEAYQTFMQAIAPVIESASTLLSTYQKTKFDEARFHLELHEMSQDPATCLPQHASNNCFERIKLTINMALPPAPLRTSHRSPWIFVTLCGTWLGGDMDFGDVEGLPSMHRASAGDVVVVKDGVLVGGKPFSGERYQLELFLPDV